MGPWTSIILAAFLAILAFGYLLDYLNIRHQARSPGSIPGEFAPYVDVDVLARAEGYAAENARFGAVASIYDNAILVGFVFGGGLVLYDRWIASLGLGFAAGGVVFFLLLLLGRAVLFVPFGLYRVFVIERRHGFCSMTPGLWVSDFLKSTAISMVLASAAAYGGLLIVQASPTLWWLWLWAFFLAASLLVMYISPRVIEPLFNRFTPVDDPALVEAASDLMARAGIRVAKVFKMDASRRTGHTNAYFAGLGRTKRIVLYDTILEKLDREEVLSVLAHEAGHWTGRHLVKRLAVMEAVSFAALYAAFRLVGGSLVGTSLVGTSLAGTSLAGSSPLDTLFSGVLHGGGTFYARVVVLTILGAVVFFPVTPLLLYLSRRQEREADAAAVRLTGRSGPMIRSIAKLARDNLSGLHPHPLYVAFRFTHPPALERVRALEEEPGSG